MYGSLSTVHPCASHIALSESSERRAFEEKGPVTANVPTEIRSEKPRCSSWGMEEDSHTPMMDWGGEPVGQARPNPREPRVGDPPPPLP